MEDWGKVLWTDESRVALWGDEGPVWCFRERGADLRDRDVRKVVKHGGGAVMIWGCISLTGPGRCIPINGNIDSNRYMRLCIPHALWAAGELDLPRGQWILQQDNAPCHVSRRTLEYLREGNIGLFDWPPNSPDLNPIEHIWADLKRRLFQLPKPKNMLELAAQIEHAWDDTSPALCKALVESMPRRMAAVVAAKGGYTKY